MYHWPKAVMLGITLMVFYIFSINRTINKLSSKFSGNVWYNVCWVTVNIV